MLRCTLWPSVLLTLLTVGCFGTPDADRLFDSSERPGVAGMPGSIAAPHQNNGAAGATDESSGGAGGEGFDGEVAEVGNAGSAGSTASECTEIFRTCKHTFQLEDFVGAESDAQLWGVFPPNVWSSGIALHKSGTTWSATVDVPRGFEVHYKYLVDGEWMVDPETAVPAVADLQGGGMSSVLAGQDCAAWECGAVEVPDCPEAKRAAHLRMVFEDAGYDAVELAGSFNDWHPTSMTRVGTQWAVNLSELPWGSQVEYKFVVDGQWVRDPSNFVTSPDGYGGVNSVLRVEGDWWSCAG